MIPVEQTKFGLGGNCMVACLASIFEVPIDVIPDAPFEEGLRESVIWQRKWDGWQAWLRRFGLAMVELNGDAWKLPGFTILGVISKRPHPKDPAKNLLHTVVARDGEIVWDPHPERAAGVGDRLDCTAFVALDPSRPWGGRCGILPSPSWRYHLECLCGGSWLGTVGGFTAASLDPPYWVPGNAEPACPRCGRRNMVWRVSSPPDVVRIGG